MKILCLYNNDIALELFEWIRTQVHETVLWSDRLDKDWCHEQGFDLAVSYTYRYIVKADVLAALNYNVVNIHNSYLPFNRGADPNLWSILDNTPRGVTLHYMNTDLDKGEVITQSLCGCADENGTLTTTYNELDKEAKDMFKKAFLLYNFWPDMKKNVNGIGSYHKVADGDGIKAAIKEFGGYDITIRQLKSLYGCIDN